MDKTSAIELCYDDDSIDAVFVIKGVLDAKKYRHRTGQQTN